CVLFFFFQAEDGIRDRNVTGVQTCALPIFSAGLDYPGVGPEHSLWSDVGRVQYVAANDNAVLEAFRELTRVEGIMPALESAHARSEERRVGKERGCGWGA